VRARIGKRPRNYHLAIAALLGTAAAVVPAVASSETSPTVDAVNTTTGSGIYTEERHSWSPSQVTVMAGGAVTFRNATSVPHGIEWRGAVKPACESTVPVGTTPAASGTEWSGACTFSQAGTYLFYCTVHGPEMTGTVTVDANGTTTVTTTTGPTTTTTTPTGTPAPAPSPESPLTGALEVAKSQRGDAVRGSLGISQAAAGGRLQVDVFAPLASLAKTKRAKTVRVGHLVRSHLSAGRLSFSVRLDAAARRSLRLHRRLALTVRTSVAPLTGKPVTVVRRVVAHG
jgi:plastocyanin